MTMTRATPSKVAVLALTTLTFGTACGAVSELASTDGDPQSEVVSGEAQESESSSAEVEEAEETEKADAADAAAAELKVVDYGFTQLDGGEYGEPGVTFGVVIKNSGSAIATNAQVQISFTDSSGTVVDTHEDYLTAVLPGTSVAFGDYLYDANNVNKMTVQAMPGQSEPLEGEPANFKVSKVNTRAQEFGGLKTTATVESPFTKDLKDLQAVAIYRDKSDKIIGGDFTFLNFVPAGGKASVSIDSFTEGLTPASTDVHIALSGLTLLD
ncbi:hypothetical protein [Janibacter alittae]|uniref:DUF4352 domain-containing protein n=1 Tax=Janibacter alittae TaxID=3115209 RepID=A0ABZ2MKG2_9MICO